MDTAALDIISAMRRQEDTTYQKGDFLALADSGRVDVDADCRTKMAEWCFQIVDFCKFQRESVEIAMNLLDRYLLVDTSALSQRVTFQLASMTSLYMAVKIHEPEAMDPDTVSTLSRGTYSAHDIENMELQILKALEWRVNPPTSVSFARQLLALLPDEMFSLKQRETISQITATQMELAVSDYNLIEVKPSLIAFCSILNAVEGVGVESKSFAQILHLMSTAIGINCSGEDIQVQELTDYLFYAAVQGDTTMTGRCPQANPDKSSHPQQRIHRRASFEGSPRTIAIR